jgi:GNAT superfamily N-acetyltransferase
MPRVDALVETNVHESFRVQQVAGLFDLPLSDRSVMHFHADLPGLHEPWQIGAIVGPSGSGKSILAHQAYNQGAISEQSLVTGFDWPRDQAIVDAFPDELDGQTITRMLGAVGFSSPPAWVRPFHVLSNGEQFRCNLARALLLDQPLVAVDEFTSVIDRQVAHFASAAIARAMRKGEGAVRCQRFVAVTCHDDILPWLQPDWWFDTSTGKLHWGSLQRPGICIQVHRCRQHLWPMFERHHYLSSTLNPAARCYIARWQDRPIAFCATMHQTARKPRRRIHRLVVLPDYQGLGVGPALLNAVAKHESKQRKAVSIVTSHPVLIRTLDHSPHWQRMRTQRIGQIHGGFLQRFGRTLGSPGRATASYLYQPEPQASGDDHESFAKNRRSRPATSARHGAAPVRRNLSGHRQAAGRQSSPGHPRPEARSR